MLSSRLHKATLAAVFKRQNKLLVTLDCYQA